MRRFEMCAAISLATLFFFGLVGCTHLFKSKVENTVFGEAGSAEGQWRGKALVRDARTRQATTLELEIIAQEPSRLRLEAVGNFGIHVASVVLNGDLVQIILTQQKKFIESSATGDALGRILPIQIPPRTLLRVLFDRHLDSRFWRCVYDAQSLPVECSHLTEEIAVKWQNREHDSRRLQIGSAESSIDMLIEESKSKVEFNDRAFRLDPPDDYVIEVEPGL